MSIPRRINWRAVGLSRQLTKAGWKRTRRKGGRFNRPQVLYTRFWTGETAKCLEDANRIEIKRQRIANTDVYP